MSSGGFVELNAIAAELEQVAYATTPKIVALLTTQGANLKALAQSKCPTDTGRLRNSISATVDPARLSVVCGPFAFYGHMVEFGTSKMGPQAFMGPSADEIEPEFIAAMEQLGGDVL